METFGQALAALEREIEADNEAQERSGLLPDEWGLLKQAEAAEDGRVTIHHQDRMRAAEGLQMQGLGEYVPPADLKAKPYFKINDQGQHRLEVSR